MKSQKIQQSQIKDIVPEDIVQQDQGDTRKAFFQTNEITEAFQNQNESAKGTKENFTDMLFPPYNESIYSTKENLQSFSQPEIPAFMKVNKNKQFFSQDGLADKSGKYDYKKISEIYNKPTPNIFNKGKPSPKDVVQGELGNCYFQSTMKSLAEQPEYIEDLFPNANQNKNGSYEANVYINGEPTNILVDDYFPVNTKDGKLAFAQVNEDSKNLWPVILEKVWAKCNMSYEDTIKGNCVDAFEFLSPAPIDMYSHEGKLDEANINLFDEIKKGVDNGYIVVTDINTQDNEEGNKKNDLAYLAKLGLLTNHCYHIIKTAVLKPKKSGNNQEIKLLKIRNPYKTNEYTGDWSEGNKKWEDEFRKVTGETDVEEDTFWINFEEYLNFYTHTYIIHTQPGYSYSSARLDVSTKNPCNTCTVDIQKEGPVDFIVNLKSKRIMRQLKDENYENPYCIMSVYKKIGDKYEHLGSEAGNQDRLYVSCDNVPKGTYYISVTFPSQNIQGFDVDNEFPFAPMSGVTSSIEQSHNSNLRSKVDENIQFPLTNVVIGVYSPNKNVKITPAGKTSKINTPDYFFDAINDMAQENKEKYYFTSEGEPSVWRAIDFKDTSSGFGYIFYCNNSNAFIKEKMNVTNIQNVNIIPILRNGTLSQNTLSNGEVEYEDENTTIAVENLKKKTPLESTAEVVSMPRQNKEISNNNPLVIQFNIAPNSQCAVLLQKSADNSNIDMSSDIVLEYLPFSVITDPRFKSKKYRLKYNGKPVDVFEVITDHNTGVVFKYKNNTPDLLLNVNVNFDNLNNLRLRSVNADNYEDSKNPSYREANYSKSNRDFKIEDDEPMTPVNEKKASVFVNPGECKYFYLSALDPFKKYSYGCHIDYRFSKKIDMKLLESVNKANEPKEPKEKNEKNDEEDGKSYKSNKSIDNNDNPSSSRYMRRTINQISTKGNINMDDDGDDIEDKRNTVNMNINDRKDKGNNRNNRYGKRNDLELEVTEERNSIRKSRNNQSKSKSKDKYTGKSDGLFKSEKIEKIERFNNKNLRDFSNTDGNINVEIKTHSKNYDTKKTGNTITLTKSERITGTITVNRSTEENNNDNFRNKRDAGRHTVGGDMNRSIGNSNIRSGRKTYK